MPLFLIFPQNNEKSWMVYSNGKDQGQNDHLNVNNNNNSTYPKSPSSPKLWSPLNNNTGQLTASEAINGSTLGVKSIQERILNSPTRTEANRSNNHNLNGSATKDSSPRRRNISDTVTRPLLINDLDFTDLKSDDDCDIFQVNFFHHDDYFYDVSVPLMIYSLYYGFPPRQDATFLSPK